MNKATEDSSILDWRVGWLYALRRDNAGVCWHFQVVEKTS
jgi:hypothetical protein